MQGAEDLGVEVEQEQRVEDRTGSCSNCRTGANGCISIFTFSRSTVNLEQSRAPRPGSAQTPPTTSNCNTSVLIFDANIVLNR